VKFGPISYRTGRGNWKSIRNVSYSDCTGGQQVLRDTAITEGGGRHRVLSGRGRKGGSRSKLVITNNGLATKKEPLESNVESSRGTLLRDRGLACLKLSDNGMGAIEGRPVGLGPRAE